MVALTKAVRLPALAPCGCPMRLIACRTCGQADYYTTDCAHDLRQPTECATCEATWSA
jgi:hypothetical protein